MPSTRTYRSILHTVNNATVAMSSSATASRIPAPLPIALASSIPRPVNSLSVARKHTPTIQRARPTTSIASLASSFAAMVISKPVNQAIAPSSAAKPASSLPCIAAPCSKLASDRIQARRQRVIAKLQPTKKRPTAPESTRAVPPAPPAPPAPKILVSILKTKLHEGRFVTKKPRVIPPPSSYAPPSTVVSSWTRSTSSLKPRGNQPYCESRPCILDRNGNRPRIDYDPMSCFGRSCTCHAAGGMIPTQHWVYPHEWETTPAEADVDPTRPRIVRFAHNPVRSTMPVSRWWTTVWPLCGKSKDATTEAEDDAAILAMDNPPPVRSDFKNMCEELMDQYFPDDDDDE